MSFVDLFALFIEFLEVFTKSVEFPASFDELLEVLRILI